MTIMPNDSASDGSGTHPKKQFLRDILPYVTDPILRRLLSAYSDSNPVNSMELELENVLFEILNAEWALSQFQPSANLLRWHRIRRIRWSPTSQRQGRAMVAAHG
jgi:hypothetical protein